MRKILSVWTMLMMVLVLAGCEPKETAPEPAGPDQVIFNAVVLEVNGESLLVEPAEETSERKSSDKIQVGLSGMSEDKKSELLAAAEAGDVVCITYNGGIMETYPAQISASDVTIAEKKTQEPETAKTGTAAALIRVNGELYYDTGRESANTGRCGVLDGEIDSTVAEGDIPEADNQSNFGTGYGFQYASEDQIELYIDGQWRVFEKYQ